MSEHRIEETIARGMCIGCGACAVASGGAIRVDLSPTRLYQPDISAADAADVRAGSRVCPFSDESPNEDQLGVPHPEIDMGTHPVLGAFTQTFAGRVTDSQRLNETSSGGLTSWLLDALLAAGEIDAVINVGAVEHSRGELFAHSIAPETDKQPRGKSQYYATTMAEVLTLIKAEPAQRYALVGVPCFIRAARSLCREDSSISDRLTMFVALVCGHLKTHAYAESLAWQLGIHPSELEAVDFRMKVAGRPASDYRFGALQSGESDMRTSPMADLLGGDWGLNAFQPEACNFCDDVVGETADVSFGDAWLPEFEADSRGTNVVVSRNKRIDHILAQAAASAEIQLFPATPADVAASQAGGFRHRREGLAVRLADDIAAGLSVPKKRVQPDVNVVDERRARLYRQRRRIAQLSHGLFAQAVENNNLNIYLKVLRREIRRYRRLEAPKVRIRRSLSKVKQRFLGPRV